jgi:hypothetical protein
MTQPKTHKYNRNQRLLHAKNWINKYTGKKLHHGYAKYFGVSKLCAVIELELLGINFSPELKESLIRAEDDKRKLHSKSKQMIENYSNESDDNFAFIIGYTSNGFPYGIRREEMKHHENKEYTYDSKAQPEDDDLPF